MAAIIMSTTTTATTPAKICKKTWTPEEDAKMLALIQEHGTTGKWTLICAIMGDRSSKQCRERYANHLHPDIRKGHWTKAEDDLIDELCRQMGQQWAKICKFLPGRSDNAVKNRWYIHNRPKDEEAETTAALAKAAAASAASAAKAEKKARPAVPTLCLDACQPFRAAAATAAALPVQPQVHAVPVTKVDLLEMYHNHHDCCHEVSLSSRSEGNDAWAGESSSARLSSRVSARLLLCSARFSDLDETDGDWMEELLYSDESSDDDDEETMHQMMLKVSVSNSSSNSSSSSTSAAAVPMLNLTDCCCRIPDSSRSQRDEGPILTAGADFDCDLFDLDALEMAASSTCSPGIAGVGELQSTLKRTIAKFTPRTMTPRSPMFLVKRQRGSLSARLLSTAPRS